MAALETQTWQHGDWRSRAGVTRFAGLTERTEP
jgi:hypothetical protein